MGLRRDIPREKIPWFPTVDKEKCTGCRTCYEFCRNNAFAWNEKENVSVVANPYNCVVGCSSCESQCPAGAISFPPLSILKEFMENKIK